MASGSSSSSYGDRDSDSKPGLSNSLCAVLLSRTARLPACRLVCLSVCLPACLSVRLPVYLFVCLAVCLFAGGAQAFMQMFGPNALTKNTLTAFTLGECLLVAIEISRDTHTTRLSPPPNRVASRRLCCCCCCCPKGRKMPASYSPCPTPTEMAVAEKCFIALGTLQPQVQGWLWLGRGWFCRLLRIAAPH